MFGPIFDIEVTLENPTVTNAVCREISILQCCWRWYDQSCIFYVLLSDYRKVWNTETSDSQDLSAFQSGLKKRIILAGVAVTGKL